MTGHICPECGVHRPGCACARAELAAAEDFDPLRIRPYVTLDSPEDAPGPVPERPASPYAAEDPPTSSPYDAEDPPTARLAAIRPDDGAVGAPGAGSYQPAGRPAAGQPMPGQQPSDPYPAGHQSGQHPSGPHRAGNQSGQHPSGQQPSGPHPAGDHISGQRPSDPYPAGGSAGDPSETMPLLLRGVGDVPPLGQERERGRGRRRGLVVAAVAAAAVAGTAALAAAVLGGGDEAEDRAAVPEVTTSASLNLAVSEEPSPTPSSSSASPEPTSSSPTPRMTSASPTPTPSATPTTASPSASPSPTGAGAPPASPSTSAPTTAPTPTAPTTAPPPTESPDEEEAPTLSLGSTGSEVRELQRRLTAVWVYRGRIDGKYDEDVRDAVALYQVWLYIQGDPEGVYGSETRRTLEQNTPDI
ncbi:peptidoglycan-binding protein [Streptomyces lateritius]|uniref:peptidoglycan-binding domain-containing protein n=1 Tax=Streptomyces lateritius TaxID=67313 RepID=UPI001C8B30FF|nr:peptidoglycan-binding domain-containing protein [Streptomyces lateritius]MBX9425507.1 peptidoglycan-binding protein [Streptomyces lateritius]